jgi:hypothetical protein
MMPWEHIEGVKASRESTFLSSVPHLVINLNPDFPPSNSPSFFLRREPYLALPPPRASILLMVELVIEAAVAKRF